VIVTVCKNCNKPMTYEALTDPVTGKELLLWNIKCVCGSGLWVHVNLPEEMMREGESGYAPRGNSK
jgi:hypothetical protein